MLGGGLFTFAEAGVKDGSLLKVFNEAIKNHT